MPDDPGDPARHSPATPEPRREPTIWDPEVERLDEAECWRLISAGGVPPAPAIPGQASDTPPIRRKCRPTPLALPLWSLRTWERRWRTTPGMACSAT